MADLALSVKVGASNLEMQNPPSLTITSPNVYSKVVGFSFGDTVWHRYQVSNDFMHGKITVQSVKDEPQLVVAVRFYAANLVDLWSYLGGTVIPAWEADDYNVQFSINSALSTFECGPADHKMGSGGNKGDMDPHQLRAYMQELVFTAPRNPVAVTGPNY